MKLYFKINLSTSLLYYQTRKKIGWGLSANCRLCGPSPDGRRVATPAIQRPLLTRLPHGRFIPAALGLQAPRLQIGRAHV